MNQEHTNQSAWKYIKMMLYEKDGPFYNIQFIAHDSSVKSIPVWYKKDEVRARRIAIPDGEENYKLQSNRILTRLLQDSPSKFHQEFDSFFVLTFYVYFPNVLMSQVMFSESILKELKSVHLVDKNLGVSK